MNENATPAPAPATLGVFVRRARKRAGFSFRDLAAITGISRPMLQRLELGQLSNPSPTLLRRLAEALELNSDDLFAFAGYRPSGSLPSLAPYLRAKYQLPPRAVAEAHVALQSILEKYDRTHPRARAAPDTDTTDTTDSNSTDSTNKTEER